MGAVNMRMIYCIGIISIILILPFMAFANNFITPLPDPPEIQDVLPALIWNPYHLASGDSILSSLLSADYQAVQTDSLSLYIDSLSNYHLFVMGGIEEQADSLIEPPNYYPYRAAIDTFLVRGGRCFWEGLWSWGDICSAPDSENDYLLCDYFQCNGIPNEYSYSYLRGVAGTYFENIDSLGIDRFATYDVLSFWHGGIGIPIRAPEALNYGKAGVCIYNSSRTMLTNFSWSRLHDRYTNTRRDLIIDIMNWLSSTTGIEPNDPTPMEFSLSQNYPNPFNASTTIKYNLPKSSDVSIEIFDILGRKVETLVSGNQSAGSHSVIWNAQNATSGVYFYRIQAGDYSDTKRCLLLK